MSVSHTLAGLLWLASPAPAWDEAAPLDPLIEEPEAREGEPDELDDGEQDEQTALSGRVFPGLIEFRHTVARLHSDGFYGARTPYQSDAMLEFTGEVGHPFDGSISDLYLGISLLSAKDEAVVWRRLTSPPLQLLSEELNAELPAPLSVWTPPSPTLAEVLPNALARFDVEAELGEITMDPFSAPRYLLNVEGYTLIGASARDVIAIVQRGGAADHAALAAWAREQSAAGTPPFEEADRARVMAAVLAQFRKMRAPPSLGDFQRLHALSALVQTFATEADTEPLLALEGLVRILQASAIISFEFAQAEERAARLAVHGMRALPSREEFSNAPVVAMQVLKRTALHRLLRLAFDPHDFRHAPASMQISPYQEQAQQLLEPLDPTQVSSILQAAYGNTDIEREVFRYYVDVEHAPAVEPLVNWLLSRNDEIEGLGKLAATRMHETMLPAVLQHYVNPDDPSHRPTMRKLLLQMPPDVASRLVEAVQAVGLVVPAEIDAATPAGREALLDQFEAHEQVISRDRAQKLLKDILEHDDRVMSMRLAVRSAARLAQLAPDLLVSEAPRLIELLAEAARQFDDESPAERIKALVSLDTLPWGEHVGRAQRAAELARADLELRHGDAWAAVERLLELDPNLETPEVRSKLRDLVTGVFEQDLAAGHYDAAQKMLELAAQRLKDDIDVEGWKHRLLWKRYQPAFLLSGVFLLSLVTGLAWLLAVLIRKGLALLTRIRGDKRRMQKRRKDAEANAAEVATFATDVTLYSADGRSPTGTIIAAASPRPATLPRATLSRGLSLDDLDPSESLVMPSSDGLDEPDPLSGVGSWLDDPESEDGGA